MPGCLDALMPPHLPFDVTADAFDLLGLPAAFDLDPADLQRAYLERAARVHPDLAGGGDDQAARESARLNEARRVLGDPELRASALLARLGGPAKEQEKSLPPGFLAAIMETREEVEGALASGDSAARARWESWAAARRSEHIESVGRLFRGLGTPTAPQALRAIRVELNAWRYTERLIEQLTPGP